MQALVPALPTADVRGSLVIERMRDRKLGQGPALRRRSSFLEPPCKLCTEPNRKEYTLKNRESRPAGSKPAEHLAPTFAADALDTLAQRYSSVARMTAVNPDHQIGRAHV